MSDRFWRSGPPPHVGWWNASSNRSRRVWRWWNGETWSAQADVNDDAESSAISASFSEHMRFANIFIEWSDYYPKNALVPRIDPRKA